MQMQHRHMRFDQFKPFFSNNEDAEDQVSEQLYDLSGMFKAISEKIANKKVVKKNVFGENYIFHICKQNSEHELWQIQILHLRENLIPGIAGDDGTYELIKLEDGKHIAESITALYDGKNYVLFLERYKYGISIRALENLLAELSPENTMVLLKPLVNGNKINDMTESSLYRKVILVADVKQMTKSDTLNSKGNLFKTLNSFSKYQGRFIRVELGFSRQRTGFLQSEETSKLIREAYDFDGTQTLQVREAADNDSAFETIDLLDDRACFSFDLDYSREFPIVHERIFSRLLDEYKEKFEVEGNFQFKNFTRQK